MDRLEELADAEHKLRYELAEAEQRLDFADMVLRAARAKRCEQLRVEEAFGKRDNVTMRERIGHVDIEIQEGVGPVSEAWQAWSAAKTAVAKLGADAAHARNKYFDYKQSQGRM